MKALLGVVVCAMLAGCAPMADDTARRALEANGLKDVKLQGIALIGCDEKDFFRKKFTATTAAGKQVEGAVCGGFFKGATVRYD